MEAGESATWRQERVPRGGRRGCHVEAGESATWRQERVPRGGRRECHVEAGEPRVCGMAAASRWLGWACLLAVSLACTDADQPDPLSAWLASLRIKLPGDIPLKEPGVSASLSNIEVGAISIGELHSSLEGTSLTVQTWVVRGFVRRTEGTSRASLPYLAAHTSWPCCHVFILQCCGRSWPTGTYRNSVPPAKPRARGGAREPRGEELN